MKTIVLFSMAALLVALPPTRLTATTDAVRGEIQAQSHAFKEALARGDAAAAARAFTSDAKLILSGVDRALAGREAIEAFWRRAMGGGVRQLVLESHELEGEGDLRFESGEYRALNRDGQAMSRGQYLIVWKREGSEWKIHRDITSAAAQAAPASSEAQSAGAQASGSVAMRTSGTADSTTPDRVGFPADYRRAFKLLGAGGGEKDALVHTAFANEAAAGVFEGSPLPFPNGAVIAMEFANPLKDGEGQVLRDEQGVPMPGEVVRIDVMRRGAGYGAHYGDKRAGEWEFASYTPSGAAVMPPANGASCADCHRNAGADNDFVFRMRAKPGAP
jgi:ketosteroid isomerase-like protein